MKPLRILTAILTVSAASAALAAETCEVMRKVNGVLTGVQVPCADLKRPTTPGREAAIQNEKAELAARKRQCGKDFEALRIGMPVARFEQCTDGLAYVTETVTKNGTVETYRSTFYLIQVSNGKIISYTRL